MRRVLRYLLRLVLALATALGLAFGGATLGAVARLPSAADLAARYRAAGQPDGLDAISPSIRDALAAARVRERHAFIRQECARRTADIGLERQVEEALCLALSSLRADDTAVRLWWLNSAWFGRGAHGVEAGAQAWFGRGQAELSRAEAALLIAIARTPSLAERAPDRLLELLAFRLHLSPEERRAARAAILPPPRE